LLRESIAGLQRAHEVVLTRIDQVDQAQCVALSQTIQRYTGRLPIATCAHQWQGFVDASNQQVPVPDCVAGACGIGNPKAFLHMLAKQTQVVHQVVMPDHHAWALAQVRQLCAQGAEQGAKALVVTEKDWVKIHPVLLAELGEQWQSELGLPIVRPRLSLAWHVGQDAFLARLDCFFGSTG
jgi:tetraacyldisaccharide 4'-kinase